MFTGDLLRMIDERIFKLTPTITQAMGTVAYHSGISTDREAQVTFDGSQLSVPCRVPGSINISSGDRVMLAKVGTIWFVTGSWPRHEMGAGGISGAGTIGTTTSGAFATLPGFPRFTLVKLFHDTNLQVDSSLSSYSSAVATEAALGVRFTNDATAAEIEIHTHRHIYDVAGVSSWAVGFAHTYGVTIPAGSYTIAPVWARWSGAGTLNRHTSSWASMFAREVPPLQPPL